jgi:tryptophan 2,3-dioxygenase
MTTAALRRGRRLTAPNGQSAFLTRAHAAFEQAVASREVCCGMTGCLEIRVYLRRQAGMQRKEDRQCDAVVSLRRSDAAMRHDRPSDRVPW